MDVSIKAKHFKTFYQLQLHSTIYILRNSPITVKNMIKRHVYIDIFVKKLKKNILIKKYIYLANVVVYNLHIIFLINWARLV